MTISETPNGKWLGPSWPSFDAVSRGEVVLLVPEEVHLPSGWRTPWLGAGWLISESRDPDADTAELAVCMDAKRLNVFTWPDNAHAAATVPETRAPPPRDDAQDRMASTSVPATFDRGTLRRGDFLARLSSLITLQNNEGWMLLGIRIDQMAQLASFNALAVVALEEQVLARLVAFVREDEACTVWMEFGFGVLTRRENSAEVEAFAKQLCGAIADTPFQVADEPIALTVSIGIALPPQGDTADGGQRWFAIAHAAQAIAHRHGGNQFEGVLSRTYEPMPPERVLIIREWLEEAKSGSNVIVEFQPVLPLHAGAMPLYTVHTKLRDYRAPLGGVYRDEFRFLAREAGVLAMIDRLGLFTAFESLAQERACGHRTALLVPIDVSTLDGRPWRWLQAELGRRSELTDGLIFELEAGSELQAPAVLERIGLLRELGIRIGVADRSGSLDGIETWSTLPFDLLRLSSATLEAMPAQDFLQKIAVWKVQGRHIILDGVEGSDATARCAAYRVDYLSGDDVAAIGPRLDFDFE